VGCPQGGDKRAAGDQRWWPGSQPATPRCLRGREGDSTGAGRTWGRCTMSRPPRVWIQASWLQRSWARRACTSHSDPLLCRMLRGWRMGSCPQGPQRGRARMSGHSRQRWRSPLRMSISELTLVFSQENTLRSHRDLGPNPSASNYQLCDKRLGLSEDLISSPAKWRPWLPTQGAVLGSEASGTSPL
jgi:hypothetical protein